MRIDHLFMEELNEWPLVDKAMAILTDIQEIAKGIFEKKNNILETFEIPFKSAFEDFFEKEGKAIKEKNPTYLELVQEPLFQQKVIDFSLGTKKTERKVAVFNEAFTEYIEMVKKKGSKSSQEENNLDGIIEDFVMLEKIKDLVEFIYIYRYNTKLTEEVLAMLNNLHLKKYGKNFLTNHMDIYQKIEEEIENLVSIPNKLKNLENMIAEGQIKTIHFFSVFYWFYARGEIQNLLYFIGLPELPESFRSYLIELLIKRTEIKSENEKIVESIEKAKEGIKVVIEKLNNREIPIISKKDFERLILYAVKYFPTYFNEKVVVKIRNNFYNYVKLEKVKNG